MATARDTSEHDPGDESDWRYSYVYNGNCEEQCPFCGDLLALSRAWCTPVLRSDLYVSAEFTRAPRPHEKTYDEILTCCDSKKCREKAQHLARRLAIPACERAVRRRHAYYMKTGERIR